MKTEREFFDPAPLLWRPAPGFPGGVWEQVISGGEDEGVTTRLLRFDAGAGNDRVVTHDFWEEIYIVAGISGVDQRINYLQRAVPRPVYQIVERKTNRAKLSAVFKWENWKQILFGVIATLVCLYFIQPVLDRTPAFVLGVAAPVSQGWENRLFEDAAQPISMEPLVLVLILTIGMGVFRFTRPDSPTPRARLAMLPFVLLITLMSLFLVVVRATSNGIDRCFRARLAVLAPHITDHEAKELVARWTLVRTRADFEAIADTLGEKAHEHNVTAVLKSLAGPDRSRCL
jgi:hypothetical protein